CLKNLSPARSDATIARGISERGFGGGLFRWHPASMTPPQSKRNSAQLMQTAYLGSANIGPNRIAPDTFVFSESWRVSRSLSILQPVIETRKSLFSQHLQK
ncbi:MAG: hypothetical protein P8J33_02795, partial [Pirellulaceae bacterium]|nr:hypothetical protein [Pirellulaceae bacterium]